MLATIGIAILVTEAARADPTSCEAIERARAELGRCLRDTGGTCEREFELIDGLEERLRQVGDCPRLAEALPSVDTSVPPTPLPTPRVSLGEVRRIRLLSTEVEMHVGGKRITENEAEEQSRLLDVIARGVLVKHGFVIVAEGEDATLQLWHRGDRNSTRETSEIVACGILSVPLIALALVGGNPGVVGGIVGGLPNDPHDPARASTTQGVLRDSGAGTILWNAKTRRSADNAPAMVREILSTLPKHDLAKREVSATVEPPRAIQSVRHVVVCHDGSRYEGRLVSRSSRWIVLDTNTGERVSVSMTEAAIVGVIE